MDRPRALPQRPIIGIIGAGAVGGYYGARLARHGHDVHFLLRSDYQAVREHGLTIKSCDGDFHLPAGAVRAYRRPTDMPKADLVITALKTTSNDHFPELIAPLLHDNTAILTLQNGLGNEDRLAELFGRERILGGIAFVCINRGEAGSIHHLSHGLIRVGEFDAEAPSQRPRQIARWFGASGVKCEAVTDLLAVRWQKLVWNIPFNGLGAALDLTTDKLIASPAGVAQVTRLMQEVIAAAAAEWVRMPPGMIDKQIESTRSMGAYRTSMQIDRQQARPLELEAILGEPLRRAQSHGVETPALEALYAMCRVVDGAILRAGVSASMPASAPAPP